jgi:hypothetical protein
MMLQLSLDPEVRRKIRSLAKLADRIGDKPLTETIDAHDLHVGLNAFNRARLQPVLPSAEWEHDLPFMRAAEMIEARFLEEERAQTQAQVARMPRDPKGFIEWFVELKESGPGQYDPFFDYLAYDADRSELKYFIKQEFCGEIGFDDLVALTQVRFPEQAKLELARNFWDEQGQGKREDIHGPLYVTMAHEMGVHDTRESELLWETLAVANILTGLACNRRYAWHSLGAMSVLELTSPTRASRVAKGLDRIGASASACRYFELHTVVDVEHWKGWLAEVIVPLLAENPDVAVPLAEGALLRLNSGARLIRKYRTVLNLDGRLAAPAYSKVG